MDSLAKTSRFLMQATLGSDRDTQAAVAKTGINRWLKQQLDTPPISDSLFESGTRKIWSDFRRKLVRAHGERALNGDGNNPALPYKWYFHMAWWQHTLSSKEDLLRQRVAQALSEILVISDNSPLETNSIGMASYYDLLYKHAFGNYADLLYDVSMHPCMGVYLSHMNNQKADPSRHIHPDENFAREIMQLFSIGLFNLNPDGSHKRDAQGNSIASYDNRDIKELARVFTGLKAHSYNYEWNTSTWDSSFNDYPVKFDDGVDKTYKTVPFVTMTKPMTVEESYHDRDAKSLLKGHITLPGQQTGEKEIRTVCERLVAHPNTAPFIARHLINQLVTSNPSAEYVEAVARKFGKRGDMKATIEEILSFPLKHPVAKVRLKSATKQDGTLVQSQKLKSPLLRTTQLLLAFNAHNRSNKLWLIGDDIQELVQQHPVSAPTVFNFYKPNYTPHGPLEKSALVAPEFEIHTSATSIAYVNMMYYWFFGNYYPAVSTRIIENGPEINVAELDPDKLQTFAEDALKLDFSREIQLASEGKYDQLIDEMSLLLTGNTNLALKPRIKAAFKNYRQNAEWVVQTVAFMLAISPEFTVMEA